MADNILTLDGLIFEATKINFHNNTYFETL